MNIMKRCAHDELRHTHGAHQHDEAVAFRTALEVQSRRRRNPAISLRAARSMLTLSLRLHDALDLDERITKLQEELERRTAWQRSES
jgi:uncharacterized small protein (DUF1192 family)